MTEFEKELVRFVSGYLDAGVSAEDYVKAFSQHLLDSIGRQSKPNPERKLRKVSTWVSDTERELKEKSEIPTNIEADAVQFCFDKGINVTPRHAKEIATHYLMIGHNEGYVKGRKDAHIPARELGLPKSMDFQQKPAEIPSNLDEAAEECIWDSIDSNDPVLVPKYIPLLLSLFKAGAMWDREQGVSFNTEVGWIDGPTIMDWPDDILDGFEMGDKVIVQIRKKDE